MSDLDDLADALRIAFGVLLIAFVGIRTVLSVIWWAFAYFSSRWKLRRVTDPALRERLQSPTPEAIALARARGIPAFAFWGELSAQRTLVSLWLMIRVVEILGLAWAMSMLAAVISPHLVVSIALVLLGLFGMAALNARDVFTLMAIRRYLRRFPESVAYAMSLEKTSTWRWSTVRAPFVDSVAERYLRRAQRFTSWRSDFG